MSAPASPEIIPGEVDRLLERDGALATLQASVERVQRHDRGEIVTVSGEAGVGKTSLLSAFSAAAPPATMLFGACDGLRAPRPLGPFLDIAARAGGPLAEAGRRLASREELFTTFLEELRTPRQPIVLVVEDCHWADDATLDLLTFLGRRIAGTRAVIVLTYRDDEVGGRHPLRVTLGDLASAIGERIRLSPLSVAAVEALATGQDVDPRALHAVTGGNPFFVTETLAAGAGTIPDSVRDAVLARLARLSPKARRAVEAVAVVPGGADMGLVAAITEGPARGLDEAAERGMLVSSGGRIALRHDLARVAVLDAIAPSRRRGLHRLALAALTESAGADPATLAFHAVEAGDVDAILTYAPMAAEQAAAAGSHRAAATHLDQLRPHLHRLPLAEQARLLARLGEECALTNRLEDAVDAFDAAARAWRDLGDHRAEARTLVKRSGPLTSLGRSGEAAASNRAALETLEPLGPSGELAEALAAVASDHMLARNLTEAIDWSYRAEQMAAQVGDAPAVCYARIQGGVAELMAGVDGGLERINAGIDIARELGLDHRVELGLSQIGSGGGEVRLYGVAVPALEECVRVGRERELRTSELYALSWLARCGLEQGRWDDATAHATEVLASPRTVGIARMTALVVLGRLRARRGDPEAWDVLDEALSLARRTNHLQRLWPVAAARAEAAWLARRVDAELDLVEEVFTLASRLAYPWAVGELGLWRWRGGRDPASESVTPFHLHARGQFTDAARAWDALGCPYEAADALSDSADADDLRRALAVFSSLDAKPSADRVTGRLRDMGHRVGRGPTRATQANPAGLTDREVDVLCLLAEGCSNKLVATRLGITEKTAGHHVSRILTKLGVANRAEAAVHAERMGLTAAASRGGGRV